MLLQGKWFKQRYYPKINTLGLDRPVLFSVRIQSEYVAAGEIFTQRYYRNVYALSLCRPVLLLDNFQSKYVAAGESVQATILLEH